MDKPEPIAIIGSGCRFPGHASTPSKLWDVLREPRDLLTAIPEDRFNTQGFYHEKGQYHGHTNVRHSYLLSDDHILRRFDAQFFGISPAEANVIDPQMRLLLETVYEALEDAGQTIDGLQGTDTAVYAGLMAADYEHYMSRDEDNIGTYHVTGTSRALMSNRISYFFDWHGPSMTIDTACSSSLFAVHHAVQQLRSNGSRVAVAAGSNLIIDPITYITESKLQMLSPTGRSRMWDADADGYARGEGVAAVILKTLSAAVADGDNIECIIRETGVNQDGRTKGITMPSAEAQTRMIVDCYSRAGLDIGSPAGRPQYFEAHGTGTPAGDPVEAEAIDSAFFGRRAPNSTSPLFVGSIKTIIGHTEGTAGLAGILKASLALKNSTIPPNMLFDRLNPRIEPFYTNLRVATSALPWPAVPTGTPRRASVNSFGFGGANAHAILESYTACVERPKIHHTAVLPPFIFSAAYETSLLCYLEEFYKYLIAEGENVHMRDLAYTLSCRRTRFPFAAAFSASTSDQLASKIKQRIESVRSSTGERLGIRVRQNTTAKPRILGIFTGQGAQWARMGAELISNSSSARCTIERLEARLACLPTDQRPSWSLTGELQKDASSSLVNTAILSQTLCTAIQILLVDILRSAHVELTSVIGHSSGEIAAAYAAGLISAEDAICIAYYRGVHADLAQGTKGQPGAMMAVGASVEDIQDLLQEPEFQGRACVAAMNSSSSVTISGDVEVIEEIGVILKDEKKFVRRLKVDKAYHSHHMSSCSAEYLHALQKLDIQVRPRSENSQCTWFSTAYEEDIATMTEALKGPYWDSNMLNPVRFMQAVKRASGKDGVFDLGLEIGPHPALKGPALQTIQDILGHVIPYTGLLQRKVNDIEALADGLGYISTHLGKSSVDFFSCELFASETEKPGLATGLPPYSWNHEHEYWHESRSTRAAHRRSDSVHEILGHLCPDSTEQEMRWRNLLRPKEVPWMKGHQLQNQIVFPAAGYIVAALEASMIVIGLKGESASYVEVADLEIGQALTFDDEDSSAETLFSLTDIRRQGNTHITAKFNYNAAIGKADDSLTSLATGNIHIRLGKPSPRTLPPRNPRAPNLMRVKEESFYHALEKLEYHYSELFVALSGLERKLGTASGFISNVKESDLMVHPALLDVAFQSVILAASAPNDGRLWSMHIPTRIQRVRVNPELCRSEMGKGRQLPFDAIQPSETTSLSGDVDVFPVGSDHAMIQVEGLFCVPFSTATEKDDKALFSSTIWGPALPDAKKVAFDNLATPHQYDLARRLERVACFYLRRLERGVPIDHPSRHQGPYTQLFKFASHTLSSARSGALSFYEPTWEADTTESIAALCRDCEDIIDFRLLHAIGQRLPEIAVNDTTAIEIGMKDGLLTQFYQDGFGMKEQTIYLARIIKQITHRCPMLHCLEIGAGTGGATKAILRETKSFSSYTFTDISSGFFESTKATLGSFAERMTFRALDISADPCLQGFERHSYDLIVASAVLHATPSIHETLKNVRRLLKPGGYLVVVEVQRDAPARVGAIFGAFPGWWLGVDEGRDLSPCLGIAEWDALLRKTGFSGCDTTSPNSDPLVQPVSTFVSQAVDNKMAFLREPFSCSPGAFGPGAVMQDLVLFGGANPRTSELLAQLKLRLQQYCVSIKTAQALTDLRTLGVSSTTTVLSLVELDRLVFDSLEESQWDSLKTLFQQAGSILWVTQGRRASAPRANMTVGLLRCAVHELSDLDIQLLDFESPDRLDDRVLGEALLRFRAMAIWQGGSLETLANTTRERELVIDNDGELLIPRLVPNREMNDRFNSSRRPILSTAILKDRIVSVQTDGDDYILQQEPITAGSINTTVTHTLVSPVRVSGDGRLYLSLGSSNGLSTLCVILSTQNASLVSPEISIPLPVDIPSGSETKFLYLVSLHHLAVMTYEDLAEGDSVMIHDPVPELVPVLMSRARNKNIKVSFTSVDHDNNNPDCPKIHPNAPERTLKRLGAKSATMFLDLSTSAESNDVARRIRTMLPTSCRLESIGTMFGGTPRAPTSRYSRQIRDCLHDALLEAGNDIVAFSNQDQQCRTAGIGDVHRCKHLIASQSVIDWTTDHQVLTKVQPVDSQPMFSSSKTYLLAGLTSSLGVSLCQWMVHRGARHVVMASRRPSIDEAWIEEMASLGAIVKTYAIDITKKDAVASLHAEICSTMPPIAGVAQGAMVLHDKNMSETTLEIAQRIIRPKVDGSLHLNDLFQEDTLDFFVFFSSFSSVVGVPGQSLYAAANLFMVGLAEQRRRRGLAASVINIGLILGAGHIAEKQHDTKALVVTMAGVHMSEKDFHQMFAEAVIAGKPGSSAPIEITAGPRQVRLDEKVQPKWAANPLFSHLLLDGEKADTTSSSAKHQVPLETRLSAAKAFDEVHQIVRDAILDKLSALFRLDTDTMDQASLDATRLDELGIDSLMAVEIRGWLLKNLSVNYPVLKILSGISIGELAMAAVEGTPREKFPNVGYT